MQAFDLPNIHILAFDGTDQAECPDGEGEPCTDDQRLVTCAACLALINDLGRFPLNPGD